LQEREYRKAPGKTGYSLACNAAADFIYREELEAMQESGLLTPGSGFSRDQEAKIYVQDKMA
jgi:sulfite reductase (NADPH) flavoprotein alpha-component